MGSLADQLKAKGLVSKKRAKQIGREVAAEKRKKKGNKKRKRELEAEAKAAAEAERAKAEAERLAARSQRERAREAQERQLQIRQILLSRAIRARGPQPFYHRALGGNQLLRLELPLSVAHKLRCGELAIAGFDRGNRVEYLVIGAATARRLRELGARVVVFWVEDTTGISEPDLAFHQRTWEPDLRAHRGESVVL